MARSEARVALRGATARQSAPPRGGGQPIASNRPPAGAAFAYETAIVAMDEQWARIDALDSKAGIILAADGVLFGLLFTKGVSVLKSQGWVAGVILGLLGLSFVLALASILTRNFDRAPAPRTVADLSGYDADWLRWMFLPNVLDAYDVNKGKVQGKARLLAGAIFTLLVSVLTMGTYLIVSVA